MARKNKAQEKDLETKDVNVEGAVPEDLAENEVEVQVEMSEADGPQTTADTPGETQIESVDLQAELADSKNKVLRLMAEFDNFRKRTRREQEDFREYASESLLKALLPVLDDFQRTIDAMNKTDNLASLKEGVVMVNDKLRRTLEKEGLKPIESVGADFDMDLHEAILSTPVEDEDKQGKVLEEVERGYRMKDKVIRYAKVVIGE